MADAGFGLLREQLVGGGISWSASCASPTPPSTCGRCSPRSMRRWTHEPGHVRAVRDTCHDPIEPERLLADPLVRLCLDHLTPSQQKRLERDLELAVSIQQGLLPRSRSRPDRGDGLRVPAGPPRERRLVLPAGRRRRQGGGGFDADDTAARHVPRPRAAWPVAAAAGRTREHDLLREHLADALRNAREPARPGERRRGGLQRRSPAPVLVHDGLASRIGAGGLPVGMFCSADYATTAVTMTAGDTLALYTDGLSEARTPQARSRPGWDCGCVRGAGGQEPRAVVSGCLSAVEPLQVGAGGGRHYHDGHCPPAELRTGAGPWAPRHYPR